jgi:hypothetical protein
VHHKWQECHFPRQPRFARKAWLSLSAGVDIHLYNGNSSAFQAGIVVMPSSAGRIPAVMKVIAFQAKVSLIVEGKRHIVFQNVFGLKSRIFITAEFILRHEPSSETCLKGSTFICHEGSKTRSPQIIGIHQ